MSSTPELRHVLVLEDQKSRRIISLEESRYVVGRDPNSSIILYDHQASRHHATLVRVNDYVNDHYSYRLIDGNLQGQKSTNGLRVNGRPTPSHELKHGDFIEFGSQAKASYQVIAATTDLAALKSQPLLQGSSPPEPLTPLPPVSSEEPVTFAYVASEAEETAFLASPDQGLFAEPLSVGSYAETSPYPIFELASSSGQLTYLNPSARIAFPDLKALAVEHPLLKGLTDPSQHRDRTSFVREVQINQSFYEQHVQYLTESKLIRCYLLDVSRYHHLQQRYKRRKERFVLFDQLGTEGIFWVSASNKQVMETNQVFCDFLGYRARDLLTLDLYQLRVADRGTIDRELTQVTTENPLLIDKSVYRRQDGTLINLSVKISPAIYLNREVYCFVARIKSDRKPLLNDASLDPRLYDPLTQLPNRTFLNQQLSLALDHAARHQHLMAILFINLDSFKYINSSQGHAVGDRLLQQFGDRLKSLIKPRDTLARWGGDEFCLLLTQIKNAEEPTVLAQSIFDSLLLPFESDNQPLYLKSSIGIALYPQDGEDAETLLKNADTALHLTKQQGKNHHQYYHPRLTSEAAQLFNLETLLHQALEKKQFFLQYQPQADLSTGKIVGLEAFLGWRHPERGVISPSKFLPLAAKTDVILAIGQWLLQTVCEQNRSWQREGLPPIAVGINLSAREFEQLNLVEIVGLTLEKTPLDPQWLELELTELTLRKHLTLARKTLAEFQQLGVRIALDDYGTGFASLGYLNQFSFNTIKINPSLIRELKNPSQESGLIAAIVAIAGSLNLRVVAEGVETEAQVEILRQLLGQLLGQPNRGVVQGHWVSQPLSAKEMTTFLRDRL